MRCSRSVRYPKKHLTDQALSQQLKHETIDVTLPGTFHTVGRTHPITQVMHLLSDIFGGCGFSTVSGPEIEDQFHNFTALNIGGKSSCEGNA